jgi:hypothetical protein
MASLLMTFFPSIPRGPASPLRRTAMIALGTSAAMITLFRKQQRGGPSRASSGHRQPESLWDGCRRYDDLRTGQVSQMLADSAQFFFIHFSNRTPRAFVGSFHPI